MNTLIAILFSASFLFLGDGQHIAKKSPTAIKIDGKAKEQAWDEATWYALDERWLGEPYTPADFSGRFKLTWTEEALYVLVEVTDDQLVDTHEDGLDRYWDDDCVEIFIDEDDSDGIHQFSHNAFAYHVGLDYKVADFNSEGPAYYNEHVESKRTKKGTTYVWEHKVYIFTDDYKEEASNIPVTLQPGKIMGFALAYCDNDNSAERENFIGSVYVAGEDKNRGYIDAGIFGTLQLVE